MNKVPPQIRAKVEHKTEIIHQVAQGKHKNTPKVVQKQMHQYKAKEISKMQRKTCGCRGEKHDTGKCPAYGVICNYCDKRNHYAEAKACQQVKQRKKCTQLRTQAVTKRTRFCMCMM